MRLCLIFLTKNLTSDSEIFIPDSNARYAPREYKKRAVVLLLSPQANNRISFIATTLPRKRGDGNFTTQTAKKGGICHHPPFHYNKKAQRFYSLRLFYLVFTQTCSVRVFSVAFAIACSFKRCSCLFFEVSACCITEAHERLGKLSEFIGAASLAVCV